MGVAARAEGAWPMGQALELWVCSLKGVVSETPSSLLRIEFSLAVNQMFEVSRSLEEVSRSLGSCFHEWC